MRKLFGAVLIVFLLGTGYWAWTGINKTIENVALQETTGSSVSAKTEIALTRRSDAANVTVDIVFFNPLEAVPQDELVFRVALNTHSVPLSKYNIVKSVQITTDKGVSIEEGFAWQPESEANHHRSGLLKVRNTGILDEDTKWVRLELKNLSGVPIREFKWEGADLK
ncbi:MAG: hypothetical protein M0021_05335 [Clostridia bacterium]|nr:hypothetical protein [Clostridia bacterium]